MKNRDYAISIIRVISTSFIVICHMMKYYDCELAWWFNVGVQIFLCMSGWLYGTRQFDNTNWIDFYKLQFRKILLDYYLVVISAIIIYYIGAREYIDLGKAFGVLVAHETLEGGGHLWYIPYILLCYLITPVVAQSVDRIIKNNLKGTICKALIYISVFVLIIEVFFNYFNSAWLICYILGFILSRINATEKEYFRKCKFLFVFIALVCNSIQIYLDYILRYNFQGKFNLIYGRFCDFSHVALGIGIFLILRDVFNACYKNNYPKRLVKVLAVTDSLCFDIYLVHEFFITGPFSLMSITQYKIVNMVLVLIVILVLAFVVNKLSKNIQQYIVKR